MNRCINGYYEKSDNDKIIEEDDIRALIDACKKFQITQEEKEMWKNE